MGELRKFKCILVYSNPPILPLVALLAKKFFKTKIIFVAYDLYPEIAIRTRAASEKGIISRLMNYINRKLYGSASSVIALSSEMKDFIVKNRPIDAEKVAVIPNWYNSLEIKNIDYENIYKEKYQGKLVVSYFGNMGTCQDIETIIDAAHKLKNNNNIKFMFAGHGKQS